MIKRKLKYLFNAFFGKSTFQRNQFNNVGKVQSRLIAFPWYLLTVFVAILDLIFLGSIISGIFRISNGNKRLLTHFELGLLSMISNDDDFLLRIVIIENSWLAKLGRYLNRLDSLGLGIADTIHFSRTIDPLNKRDQEWLIHEVAHILQYKYRGLIYIPEALIAQRFSGYEFGGITTLGKKIPLRAFNPEQQADIFTFIVLSDYNCYLKQEIIEGNW